MRIALAFAAAFSVAACDSLAHEIATTDGARNATAATRPAPRPTPTAAAGVTVYDLLTDPAFAPELKDRCICP